MRKFYLVVLTLITMLLVACGSSDKQGDELKETQKNVVEEDETDVIEESDTEILMRENHPQYLDDTEVAYDVWEKEIDAGKIVLPGVWETIYGDDHILELESYSTDITDDEAVEFIGALTFYFLNFDKEISLEEALTIIKSYLPKDIIQKYYYEERSFFEVDDGEESGTRYVKCFRLKNENEEISERFNSTFDVLIWTDEEGKVSEARIDSVGFADFDNAEVWDYELFDE